MWGNVGTETRRRPLSDESFWVEFKQRLAAEGVDAVLTGWGESSDPELAGQLRRVLDLEAHHLRNPDHAARAEFPAQQVLTRAYALGATRLARAVVDRIHAERRLVLCERWRTQAFSPALLRTLAGHGGGVVDAAFASDGGLYTLAGDGELKVWDATTGTSNSVDVGTMPDRTRPVRLAVSPDDVLLAIGLSDHTIRIVRLADGADFTTLGSHGSKIMRLQFFRDGSRRLVSSGDYGFVRLWDVDAGQLARTFEGHTSFVPTLAVSLEARTVVSGSIDGTLRLWDAESGTCRQIVSNGDDGWVTGVAYTADDTTLVTSSQSGGVHRYAVEHGCLGDRTRLDTIRPGRFGPAWSVTPVDDGRVLVTNDDAVVDVWNTRPFDPSSSRESSLAGHARYTRIAAVSPDRRLAVTGDDSGRLLVWDTYAAASVPDTPLGLHHSLKEIAVSQAAGLVVYSTEAAPRICARDIDTVEERWLVDERDGTSPGSMWFSDAGLTLNTLEHELVHRSAHTGEVKRTIEMPGVLYGTGSWVVTGTTEYSAAERYRVGIADNGDGIVRRSVVLPASHDFPRRMAGASQDLATVVVAVDGVLTAWHTATGETTSVHLARQPATWTHNEEETFLLDVAVDDEGCHALGGDAVGRAHIWDIRTGEVTVVQADSEQVQSVAGLACHRAVTVGFRDGMATVWDLTTARPACLAPLDSVLTAVSVDGSTIVVGDAAGNAHVLVLLQGDPTPPPPPPPPPEQPPRPTKRPSLLRRIVGID